MLHRVLKWSVMLLGVMLLAACAVAAPADAPAEMDADAEAMDETMAGGAWDQVDPSGETISFWYQHSGGREEELQQIIADFNATNEWGITVNGEYQGGYGDIFNKMLNVIGTADTPNLVVAYQNQAATYQLGEGLVDLREMVDSEVWGLTAEEVSDFFPGFYYADLFPSFDNARLGFPPNRSMEVMFYNKDWLAELGYDSPPATPEEFREMACAAPASPFSGKVGDTPALGYQLGVDPSTVASLTFSMGGDIFDYDNVAYTYDDPATLEAMTFIQALFADGCAGPVIERYGDQTDFGNGALLFAIGSSSGLPYFTSAVEEGADFDWDIAPLPRRTDEPVVNVYGASVSVGQSTPEKELASWLFLKYYTTPEIQARWARASNYFPVRQSVAEGLEEYFAQNPRYLTAFELLEYGRTEPPVPGYDFVRDLVGEMIVAVVEGADVAEALAFLTEEANIILQDQMADQ